MQTLQVTLVYLKFREGNSYKLADFDPMLMFMLAHTNAQQKKWRVAHPTKRKCLILDWGHVFLHLAYYNREIHEPQVKPLARKTTPQKTLRKYIYKEPRFKPLAKQACASQWHQTSLPARNPCRILQGRSTFWWSERNHAIAICRAPAYIIQQAYSR